PPLGVAVGTPATTAAETAALLHSARLYATSIRGVKRSLQLASSLQPEIRHVQDDRQIYEKDGNVQQIEAAKQFVNLKGQVNRAAAQGEPLGPSPFAPQSIGFEEAQRGVPGCPDRHRPKLGIGHFIGQIQEDLCVMRVRADVQKLEEAFRHIP